MRVLHLTSGNLFGGVETLLVTFARSQALCPGMQPEFAVCFEGRLSEALSAAGAPPFVLGAVRVRNPLSIWRARCRLATLLRQRRFDVAICHMEWPLAMFGSVVRSAGVPLVFWAHSVSSGKHWVDRWAQLRTPDLVISASRFVAESETARFEDVPSEVIYAPVAPSRDSKEAR
jgi:hypothetical protein